MFLQENTVVDLKVQLSSVLVCAGRKQKYRTKLIRAAPAQIAPSTSTAYGSRCDMGVIDPTAHYSICGGV
jgi:hypothetical protein